MKRRGRLGALGLLLLAAASLVAGAEEVRVRASRDGFEPARITVRRAEAVRLVLSSVDAEHCFAIDALRVEKRIRPGRETVFDLSVEQAGEYPFYCCLGPSGGHGGERGLLVVTE